MDKENSGIIIEGELVPDMTDTPAVTLPAVVEAPKPTVNLSDLMKAILRLEKSHARHRHHIQTLLVQCCAVAFDVETHKKNVAPFTALVKATRGLDQKALIGWIVKHAPAMWKEDEAKCKRFVFNNSFEGEFDADALMKDSWWDYARPAQNVADTVDFSEMLNQFIKRMEREVTSEKKTIEHLEVLKAVKAVRGQLAQAEIQ